MVIDLRTEVERRRRPMPSDVQIEVPIPPLRPEVLDWLRSTLLHIAYAHRRDTFEVFCAKGKRSKIAAKILSDAGYKVIDRGGVG